MSSWGPSSPPLPYGGYGYGGGGYRYVAPVVNFGIGFGGWGGGALSPLWGSGSQIMGDPGPYDLPTTVPPNWL
jgi:hypothetical protein